MTWTSETEFLLRRAEEEAILAIQSGQTRASAAHRELSLRYSAQAQETLADDPPPAFRFGRTGSR